MGFNEIELKRIDKLIGDFCRNRVPIEIQNKLRYGYRIDGQNIFIYEDRPRWDNPGEWLALDFAKLRFIKKQNVWKLYWKRASGKWEVYEPMGEAKDLHALVSAVKEDKFGCFFG